MFDIGFWELALLGVIGLIVLGPERLPVVARTLGRWVGRARQYVSALSSELEDEMSAADIRRDVRAAREQIEAETRDVTDSAQDTFDSLNQSVHSSVESVHSSEEEAGDETTKTPEAAETGTAATPETPASQSTGTVTAAEAVYGVEPEDTPEQVTAGAEESESGAPRASTADEHENRT